METLPQYIMAGFKDMAGMLGYNVLDDYKVNNDTLAGLENPYLKMNRNLNALQIGPIAAIVGALIAGQTPTKNPSIHAEPTINTPTEAIPKEVPKAHIEKEILKPYLDVGTEAIPKEVPKAHVEKEILKPYLDVTSAIPKLNYTPSNEVEKSKEMQAALNPTLNAYSRGFYEDVKQKVNEWWDIVGNPNAIKEQLQEKEIPNDMAIPNENVANGTAEVPVVDENGKVIIIPISNVVAGNTVAEKEELLPTNRDGNAKKEEDKDKKLPPIIIGESEGENTMPGMPDLTKQNMEYNMDYSGLLDWLKAEQQARYEREDQIRKETQEREDTAYSRAIEDLRKSGANINLMDIQPAQSGGGISTASGMYSGMLESAMQGHSNRFINSQNIGSNEFIAELNNATKILEAQINNNFKGDENQKQRILDLIGEIISSAAMIYAFKKGGK